MLTDTPLCVADWALIKGYSDGLFRPDIRQIAKTTAKLVYYRRYEAIAHLSQSPKDDVIASFAVKADAERLRDTLGGIAGERDKRIVAARQAASDAAHKAVKAATLARAGDA